MKRNVLLIAAAATIFAACADKVTLNEPTDNDEPIKIAFDTYHSKGTKAPVTKETDLIKENGGMGIYAYKFPADPSDQTKPLVKYNEESKQINLSAVAGQDNEYTNPVFDNTMVYYNTNFNESQASASNFHEKFTYDFPRYWDKQMYYAFFAYAPQMNASTDDNDNTDVFFNVATGLFKFKTMHEIQCASDAQDKTIGSGNDEVTVKQYSVIEDADKNNDENYATKHAAYEASKNYAIKDYLIAPCQPSEKWHATNQSSTGSYYNNGTPYEKANITVGFTFSHLLSKLNVTIKAKDEKNDPDATPAVTGNHEYKGIKSIYIKKLEIENLPKLTGSANYLSSNYLKSCQQNMAQFTNIYDGIFANNAVVTYTTTDDKEYFTSKLNIVGDGSTNGKYAVNGDDNQDNPLYILAGGKVTSDAEGLHFTNAGSKAVNGYVDQAFTYYVAPNKPNTGTKYILNLDYYVEFFNEDGGTRVEKYSRTIDLTTGYSFAEMKPSYVYNVNLVIGLDQIYIAVDDVEWNEATENERTYVPVNVNDTTL